MLLRDLLMRRYYKRRFEMKLSQGLKDEICKLTADSTVVDFGANVGLFSELVAERGAKVHAFEPGFKAFLKLQRVSKQYHNIVPHNVAAGITAGTAQLYSHQKAAKFGFRDYTPASSLISSKPNVDSKLAESVTTVDAAEFLLTLPSVEILKIDIEGFETELIPHLVKKKALDHVKLLAIETHESKWPDLEEPTMLMFESLATLRNTIVRTDWI